MNEGKSQAIRTTPQASGSSTHGINDNNPQTSSSAHSQNQYSTNHHSYPNPSKNDGAKIQQPSMQPYKTVQIISQPNHVMSNAGGNCVVVQQVANNNHAVSFQQISTSQSSQGNQTIYRHGNQTYVSTTQHQLQASNNQPEIPNSSINADGSHIQVQNAQLPPRYTSQIHQLQDGRQVQMIQVNNHSYYGQPGQQQITIQQYVPQQQQFLTNNGGQSVLITSQNQDGSRTLQALPAQIHTIQHTVSPQNQAFQLTKTGVKPIRPITTSRRQESAVPQVTQVNSNGGQVVGTANQPQPQAQVYQSFPASQVMNSPSKTRSKATPTKASAQKNSPSTQTQQITNNTGQPTALIQQIGLPVNSQIRQPNITQTKSMDNKNVPSTYVQATVSQQLPASSMPPPPLPQPKVVMQQSQNNGAPPHSQATVVSANAPVVQAKAPSPKKGSPQNRSARTPQTSVQTSAPLPYQKPVVDSFVRAPNKPTALTPTQKTTAEQQQNQKIHQILQTAAKAQQSTVPLPTSAKPQTQVTTNSRVPTVVKGSQFIVQTPSARGQVMVPIRAQSIPQMKISGMKQITVPTMAQGTLPRPAIAVIPTAIAVRTRAPAPRKGVAVVPSKYSNATAMLGKLNLDLAVGDPKEGYRMLKKHFKYLVYENECYQGQLRDSHQRLLKLERDNNYLMDRLLKYENLSDSDGEESDSSVKTIEDKVVLQKPMKRKPTTKNVFNPPPKKKANTTPNASTPSLPSGSPAVGATSSTSFPSATSAIKLEINTSAAEMPSLSKALSSTVLNSTLKNEHNSSIPSISDNAVSKASPVSSSATQNSKHSISSSRQPAQRPVFNKVSAEQINEIKKEGKVVKTMSAAAFKALGVSMKSSPAPSSPLTTRSTTPNAVSESVSATNPKTATTPSTTPSTVPIVSANVPCPVKKSAAQKTAPPKVTVEIKELPPKPDMAKPKDFRPRLPPPNLSKTNSNGAATPPKVYVPFKFMHRNPTPQARASISYSAIRSPSLARMMGPRGPSRMVRPSTRFQIVSPSPTAQNPQVIKVDSKSTADSSKGSTPESKEKDEIPISLDLVPSLQPSLNANTVAESNPIMPDVSSS